MPVRFKQVRVTRWCANPAKSRTCLRLILSDEADIDAALQHTPYTSPKLTRTLATSFKACIDNCGGEAAVIDA